MAFICPNINAQTILLQDDFSSGSIINEFRVYENRIDQGWLKSIGYGDVTSSFWTVSGGVASNASDVAATGYKLSTAAEAPLVQIFSSTATVDKYVRITFDYSVAAGDTLYAHLWGYKGISDLDSEFVSNIEGSANGGCNNGEGSSTELDAFNLKDGATSGFGGTASAISGALTGSGTFDMVVGINDLGVAGVTNAGDFTYYLIAFAKNEDGTAGTTYIDNLLFQTEPSILLQDDFSSGSITADFRVYENKINRGWLKQWVNTSEWTISGGLMANASTNAATGYSANGPAEAPLVQIFSTSSSANRHLRITFDYSVAAGDTFYAHLWGYKGISDFDGEFVSNIEAGVDGQCNNGEGSSTELDAFNLKDGATTGFGSTASAISGTLTGSGTFDKIFAIKDLNIAGVTEANDLTYYLIAFAKDEDGTPGTTSIDNLSLKAIPTPPSIFQFF